MARDPAARCCCSTSRRVGSTSAPRPRSTGLLGAIKEGGVGNLVSSSETPELRLLCDRIWSCTGADRRVAGSPRRRPRRGSHVRDRTPRGSQWTLTSRSAPGHQAPCAAPAAPRGCGGRALRQRFLAVLVLFLAVFVFFSLTQSAVLHLGRTRRADDQRPRSCGWSSIGLTFVMLTGGFDLSLGSLLAFAGSRWAR